MKNRHSIANIQSESIHSPIAANSVEELVQHLIDRANEGQSIDIEMIIRSFPQWADELKELLPVLKKFHDSRPRLFPGATGHFDQLPGRKIANYEVGRVIGRGGMGVVYEATQNPLGRRVAIKLLNDVKPSPRTRQRFEQEFRIAANLHHTNIVPVFDAGEDQGQLYFAMQLIDGADVNQWAAGRKGGGSESIPSSKDELTRTVNNNYQSRREEKPRPVEDNRNAAPVKTCFEGAGGLLNRGILNEIASLLAKVARALHYAHQKGVWHRDIKPSNILIDKNQNAWISDFGLAKLSDTDGHTHTGELAGTVRYLAPERLRGVCDARSDIYALGLVLMELVTGKSPWDGLEAPEVINRISRNESCLQSDCGSLPKDLRLIIQKAISPYPEWRYSTASDFADDLENFVECRPVSARPLSRLRNAVLWTRRNPLVAALCATIFMTLVGGIIASSMMARNWRNAALLAVRNEQEAKDERNRAVSAEADALEEGNNAIGALRFLSGVIRQTAPVSTSNQNMTARDLLNRVKDRLEATPNVPVLVEMEVRHSLGTIYWGLGDFQDAELHLNRALELAQMSSKPKQDSIINISYDLAMLYWLQSDFGKAAPLFATVVSNREKMLGENHLKTLEAVNGLGLIQIFRDEPGRAEKLYREVLGSEESSDAELSPQEKTLVALLKRGLALACLVQEKFDEAEPILNEVLAEHRAEYGEESPETAVTRSMQATLFLNTDRAEQALADAEATFRIREKLFGQSSPHTLTSAALLARVYLTLGRDDDVSPMIESVIELAEPVRDRLPPFTIHELGEVGQQLLKARRFVEAERYLRFAWEITARKFPASWRGPWLQSALGECLANMDRLSEAEPLIRDSVPLLESRQGLIPAHSRVRRVKEVVSRLELLGK